jgi:hypothetical protein
MIVTCRTYLKRSFSIRMDKALLNGNRGGVQQFGVNQDRDGPVMVVRDSKL